MRKPTKREKVLLVVLAIVSLASFSINKYAQAKAEEVQRLWVQLQIEIAEVQSKIRSLNSAREPGNGVTSSFHDDVYKDDILLRNYESSWIDDVDLEENLVLVRTMDTKTKIVFRTSPEHLKRIHIGSIAPVTFDCIKLNDGSCDFTKPNTLYVGNRKVELIEAIKK